MRDDDSPAMPIFSRVAEWWAAKQGTQPPFAPPMDQKGRERLPRIPRNLRGAGQQHCLVIGNCQARALASALQALCPTVVFTSVELSAAFMQRCERRDRQLLKALSEYDGILVQIAHVRMLVDNFPELLGKIGCYPFIGFGAYHPDLVYIGTGRQDVPYLFGPLGQYNSAIALWAFQQGLSVTQTVALFNHASYEALGYYDHWSTSCQSLINEGEAAGVPLHNHLERWARSGCFMHSINHPKLNVFIDLAQDLLRKFKVPYVPTGARYAVDEFADGPVWPVYPEVGQRLGIEGDYLFKIEKGRCAPGRTVTLLDLQEFIEGSFEAFGAYDRTALHCDRLQSGRYDVLSTLARAKRALSGPKAASTPRRTPYSDLPLHQFWRSAVATVPWREVDPVVKGPFKIDKETKVATAGSCFAQNISATLERYGFNYFVTERGDRLPPQEAERRQFGVYSARYGNVYTARQLLQLFERAFGRFHPADSAWQRPDGRFVDPFRPLIEPDGFGSREEVAESRLQHLQHVRELFEQLDVMIFTLGLTEAWRSKKDGAVFPMAPGVAAGVPDFSCYEFVNFQVADVVRDLERFIAALREVNPRSKVILTVSPVPLIATFEPQHALVATTYSKSVLRAAAGEICARCTDCVYFPSYEIITGNFTRGAYYEADLRTVTAPGVEHVMRLFLKHYATQESLHTVDPALLDELQSIREIFCDEQVIGS